MNIERVRIEDLDLEGNVHIKKAIKAYKDAKKVQKDIEFQTRMGERDKKAEQFRKSVKKVKIDNNKLSNKPNKKR